MHNAGLIPELDKYNAKTRYKSTLLNNKIRNSFDLSKVLYSCTYWLQRSAPPPLKLDRPRLPLP